VAGRAIRPATLMAEQAHRISERSSGARLTVGRLDELGMLAAAFNALLDRLQQALEARRQFLADASHELRTPVSVARTAADATLGSPTRTQGEYREALEIVSTQMKRLGRIIADMLLLARRDVDRWPLQRTSFYAEELVADCVRAMRLLASERGVQIRLTAGTDLQVSADEELLRQMVGNLLENAVWHSRRGESVDIEVSADRGALNITVRDRGPGIADADLQRIFDRFVRTGSSGTNGTGLGLAIARRIARAHHGDLTVSSTAGDGTVFRSSVPIA
jgi:signal transduction histidine kinase